MVQFSNEEFDALVGDHVSHFFLFLLIVAVFWLCVSFVFCFCCLLCLFFVLCLVFCCVCWVPFVCVFHRAAGFSEWGVKENLLLGCGGFMGDPLGSFIVIHFKVCNCRQFIVFDVYKMCNCRQFVVSDVGNVYNCLHFIVFDVYKTYNCLQFIVSKVYKGCNCRQSLVFDVYKVCNCL